VIGAANHDSELILKAFAQNGLKPIVQKSVVYYFIHMVEVIQTEDFAKWHRKLRDKRGAQKIAQRIIRLQSGLEGDVKYFGRIGEMRIDHGPGYRVYFVNQSGLIIILLCGGDKGSQKRDIAKAKEMAKEFK
jgi:putative addiction module killer protein